MDDHTSTPEEILQAVRENSVRRGLFFMQNLAALDIEGIIQAVDALGAAYDMEHWREQASSMGIAPDALDILDAHEMIYPHYFCLPDDLVNNPRLLVYYRNVAMISGKVMRDIGLDTLPHEAGVPLPRDKALSITQHFNAISSAVVTQLASHGPRRHLEMVYVNIGASMDGGWRNEVGRLAYVSVISPLLLHLHHLGKVRSIGFRLKGRLDEVPATRKSRTVDLTELSEAEMQEMLTDLENQRVIYQQIDLTNGSRVLLNRQLVWDGYRIGPDLITETADDAFPWAAELKGGADPAGSDEHWKTATQAFNRVIEAAEKTQRPVPRLSFMATILVDRVAREAALWLQQGRLASVHNLMRIANDPDLQRQFLDQMVAFFEETQ